MHPLVRLLLVLLLTVPVAVSCGSGDPGPEPESQPESEQESESGESDLRLGPGGYGFDRSDPATGIANIMAAFSTDEATATCIYEAWGDVANVPPAELTPELMTFEICDTSIFQLMTGDPRFTGSGG